MADLKLTTATGLEQQFTQSEISDLKHYGDFKYADVIRGTYIFYENKDFDPSGGGSASLILQEGAQGDDISKVNGSFYCLPDVDKGIVLFAHPDFRGHHQVTI